MAEISAMFSFSWRGAVPAIMLDAYLVGSVCAGCYQFPPGGLQSRRGHLVGGSFCVHFHNPSFRVAGC